MQPYLLKQRISHLFWKAEVVASLLTVSQLVLEGTESPTSHCSIVSQGNEIVDNYLSLNQFGVCGKSLKQ